jgi:hypothetical protein
MSIQSPDYFKKFGQQNTNIPQINPAPQIQQQNMQIQKPQGMNIGKLVSPNEFKQQPQQEQNTGTQNQQPEGWKPPEKDPGPSLFGSEQYKNVHGEWEATTEKSDAEMQTILDEVAKISDQYGPDSPQYKDAMEQAQRMGALNARRMAATRSAGGYSSIGGGADTAYALADIGKSGLLQDAAIKQYDKQMQAKKEYLQAKINEAKARGDRDAAEALERQRAAINEEQKQIERQHQIDLNKEDDPAAASPTNEVWGDEPLGAGHPEEWTNVRNSIVNDENFATSEGINNIKNIMSENADNLTDGEFLFLARYIYNRSNKNSDLNRLLSTLWNKRTSANGRNLFEMI